jgi:2-amino-4-hydroxy-6-hydroxymethyldihydropteridine diphosphokinase
MNAVIEIETDIEPEKFLKKLQEIEQRLGRKQREKWAEREIDIDILFWETETYKRKYSRFRIRTGTSEILFWNP